MVFVTKLLDRICLDKGIKERFVCVDTGDQTAQFIFGIPEQINAFVEKLNLSVE